MNGKMQQIMVKTFLVFTQNLLKNGWERNFGKYRFTLAAAKPVLSMQLHRVYPLICIERQHWWNNANTRVIQ